MTIAMYFILSQRALDRSINARCAAAQSAGRALATHHRMAHAQRMRWLTRELLQPWDARPRED